MRLSRRKKDLSRESVKDGNLGSIDRACPIAILSERVISRRRAETIEARGASKQKPAALGERRARKRKVAKLLRRLVKRVNRKTTLYYQLFRTRNGTARLEIALHD